MLRSDEGEDDLYFDSVDCFSIEEPMVKEEGLCFNNLDYEIWLNEPGSVQERRLSFLREMYLVEFACQGGFERITESSGAVSSSSVSNSFGVDEDSAWWGRELFYSGASSLFDEMEKDMLDGPNVDVRSQTSGCSPSMREYMYGAIEDCHKFDFGKKAMKRWWKCFVTKRKERRTDVSNVWKPDSGASETNRFKVKQNKKRCMEFAGLCVGQEIQAHEGFIWTMKFSPDGRYLATGGEDGIVRIWHTASIDSCCTSLTSESNYTGSCTEGKSGVTRKMSQAPLVIPEKIFQIVETPFQEFRGHGSDILDLAWSNSNMLLSSSMDKTVHLWQVGCNHCLNVFCHSDYVTCVQFNPVDENYFISGSIDGKVRIWGLSEKRVVDWAEMQDIITTLCYQPDGEGFVVGSVSGFCRFYRFSGCAVNDLQLNAEIRIQGRKKSGNRITGIQFYNESSQRVMIASEDSKLRIFDGYDIAKKYKGLPKSGSQISASFTSAGGHIISVGEDSHVYIWNYDELSYPSSKKVNLSRSCEYFFSDGVSVALPWSQMGTETRTTSSGNLCSRCKSDAAASWRTHSQRFSLVNWLSMDRQRCRGSSATWPEERLPLWNVTDDVELYNNQQHIDLQEELTSCEYPIAPSEAWGLVIVTASWDGKIRTFLNYGLPLLL